jgi:hypothetical protein
MIGFLTQLFTTFGELGGLLFKVAKKRLLLIRFLNFTTSTQKHLG